MLRWRATRGAEIILSLDVPPMHPAEWQVQLFHILMDSGIAVQRIAENCSLTEDAVLNYMQMVRGGKDFKAVSLENLTLLCVALTERIIPIYLATDAAKDWLSFLASDDVARWRELKRQAIVMMLEHGSISVVAEETRPEGRVLALAGYPNVFFLRYALPAALFSDAIQGESYKVLPLISEWFDQQSLALIGEVAVTTMPQYLSIEGHTVDPSGVEGWIVTLPDKERHQNEVAIEVSLFKYDVQYRGLNYIAWPGVWRRESPLRAFGEVIFIELAGPAQTMPLPPNNAVNLNCVSFRQKRKNGILETRLVIKSDVEGKKMRYLRTPPRYSVEVFPNGYFQGLGGAPQPAHQADADEPRWQVVQRMPEWAAIDKSLEKLPGLIPYPLRRDVDGLHDFAAELLLCQSREQRLATELAARLAKVSIKKARRFNDILRGYALPILPKLGSRREAQLDALHPTWPWRHSMYRLIGTGGSEQAKALKREMRCIFFDETDMVPLDVLAAHFGLPAEVASLIEPEEWLVGLKDALQGKFAREIQEVRDKLWDHPQTWRVAALRLAGRARRDEPETQDLVRMTGASQETIWDQECLLHEALPGIFW
jgi:hypothetical protein